MREILTICGSMRFEKQMLDIAYLLETCYGYTVLQCTAGNANHVTEEEKQALAEAHYQKIDLSDGIYVVDIRDYMGESVRQEMEYAKKQGKKVIFHSQFMSETPARIQPKHMVSVAAMVTNAAGEILLVKSPWRGWEYPGGLIEPGESFAQALHREVREEAGVEIEITGFVGICKNLQRDIVNIDFTARYLSGMLTPSEESTEVIWAPAEQAMDLITFPLTKKRLQNMLSGRGEAVLFGFHRDPFEVIEESHYPIGYNKRQTR